jgi:hypothetical protein
LAKKRRKAGTITLVQLSEQCLEFASVQKSKQKYYIYFSLLKGSLKI